MAKDAVDSPIRSDPLVRIVAADYPRRFASTFRVVTDFPFFLSVGLVCILSNLFSFFVQVAGLLPLPPVFLGSFLAYSGTLLLAFLTANLPKVSRGLFPVLG
jgi:hypothetical protein